MPPTHACHHAPRAHARLLPRAAQVAHIAWLGSTMNHFSQLKGWQAWRSFVVSRTQAAEVARTWSGELRCGFRTWSAAARLQLKLNAVAGRWRLLGAGFAFQRWSCR